MSNRASIEAATEGLALARFARASGVEASTQLLETNAGKPADSTSQVQILSALPHSQEFLETGSFIRGLQTAIPISVLIWALLIGLFFALG